MLGGLGYAFGAPVLLQHGNVIFLVGAAWVPWGLRAIDRQLRLRKPCGMAELAVVLALQVLGGDPEAAYLTAVAGAGYGVVLVLGAREWPRRLRLGLLAMGVGGCSVGDHADRIKSLPRGSGMAAGHARSGARVLGGGGRWTRRALVAPSG